MSSYHFMHCLVLHSLLLAYCTLTASTLGVKIDHLNEVNRGRKIKRRNKKARCESKTTAVNALGLCNSGEEEERGKNRGS